MTAWFYDLWYGFYTVLVGTLIMWGPKNGFLWDPYAAWVLTVGVFLLLLYWLIAARRYNARRFREAAA